MLFLLERYGSELFHGTSQVLEHKIEESTRVMWNVFYRRERLVFAEETGFGEAAKDNE